MTEYERGKRDLARDLLQKHEEGHTLDGDSLDLVLYWADVNSLSLDPTPSERP